MNSLFAAFAVVAFAIALALAWDNGLTIIVLRWTLGGLIAVAAAIAYPDDWVAPWQRRRAP